MPVVGFTFQKMSIERTGHPHGKVQINSNVGITDMSKTTFQMKSTQEPGLKIDFKYSCIYEPNIGSVNISGDLMLVDSQKKLDDLFKQWKKDQKPIPEIVNMVMNRCMIQAVVLSRDVNLPPPIQMPMFQSKQKSSKEYIG